MKSSDLTPDVVIRGDVFPELVRIIATVPAGGGAKVIGEGLSSGRVHALVLSPDQIARLSVVAGPETPFDGDPFRFRLGIEAIRLHLAYEYDPFFALSIARVDPLPHQLDAVYNYFLKLPRIRFLLADDPGAGKTIMAGLLIKELKIRGLIKRTLIITPASLCFQWQREMKDKFQENFDIVRSDILKSVYGQNPWQDRDQIVTSVSWVSRIQDAFESLMRSQWDLVIVDEAHKMSAATEDSKTLAYKLGERLSELTDHFLLMTATPHKGDPAHFCLFLRLLDKDVYGDISSLEDALKERSAPFYLRRVKEALVTFPDPETGLAKSLFTKRDVRTIAFQIDSHELDFYYSLTHFVDDQSIRAAADNSARGRALGFTMAMLQRRFASSVYAVRRSLERMKTRREKILENPEAFKQEQIDRRIPDDFEELTAEEQDRILSDIEESVGSFDPIQLRDEIADLTKLINQARLLEAREVESKLRKLKDVLTQNGVFADPKMKLLVFTEHKDTLDYLAGDGKEGRPLGKLCQWGLSVTQIHGAMKVGDRDTPGSRIYAEKEFREDRQGLVATEAAGEGINLQFCWFMVNYDIPWNPVRLEQRMGRIHRYLQNKDCLILNFVSTNTREGRVLEKLFDRIEQIEKDLDPNKTGKVFNVLGDIFPANLLEKLIRDMYARNETEETVKARIVKDIDTESLRRITTSTLEGLAKKSLNLSAIVGKSEEAKERRLVPEVIQDFFLSAAPVADLPVTTRKPNVFRVGKIPSNLVDWGSRLEPRYGRLGKEYRSITFSKKKLEEDPTLEWVTAGHPLFESLRAKLENDSQHDLFRGAVFFELQRREPALLDVFTAEIRDGKSSTIHKRLFVTHTELNGRISVKQPTIFLDLSLAPVKTAVPSTAGMPSRGEIESALVNQALEPLLAEESQKRRREVEMIRRHIELSLDAIIDRANCQFAELSASKESGRDEAGLEGRIRIAEERLDDLIRRKENRLADLQREIQCAIGNIQHLGSAWVLPHPERSTPEIQPMVTDPEIEKIAVNAVIAYEEARGCRVQSVESENRGFDLISRRPHPEDPETSVEVRFIEVKGRSAVGEIALTTNEYRTAQRLSQDYWLYVVFNCATKPDIQIIRNPGQLGWKSVMKVEHYVLPAKSVVAGSEKAESPA